MLTQFCLEVSTVLKTSRTGTPALKPRWFKPLEPVFFMILQDQSPLLARSSHWRMCYCQVATMKSIFYFTPLYLVAPGYITLALFDILQGGHVGNFMGKKGL